MKLHTRRVDGSPNSAQQSTTISHRNRGENIAELQKDRLVKAKIDVYSSIFTFRK